MTFTLFERYDHWPFEGQNYICEIGNYENVTVGLEVTMMDWLEENNISHAWLIEDRIVFKKETDRFLFVLRFG